MHGKAACKVVHRDVRHECGILAHGFARARCADCGYDFLIAFFCKGRGVCPSCNTRRMVETAAHLVDEVFPKVPVRQWVLSFPKRLRYFLAHDADLQLGFCGFFSAVWKRHFSAAARRHRTMPGWERSPLFIGLVRRSMATSILMKYIHVFHPSGRFAVQICSRQICHCCVIDGLFSADDETLRFDEATISREAIAKVQAEVRQRVLRLFRRRALLSPEDAETMRQWRHEGGYS